MQKLTIHPLLFQFTLLYKERRCQSEFLLYQDYFNSRSYIRSDVPAICIPFTLDNFNSRSYIRSDTR